MLTEYQTKIKNKFFEGSDGDQTVVRFLSTKVPYALNMIHWANNNYTWFNSNYIQRDTKKNLKRLSKLNEHIGLVNNKMIIICKGNIFVDKECYIFDYESTLFILSVLKSSNWKVKCLLNMKHKNEKVAEFCRMMLR